MAASGFATLLAVLVLIGFSFGVGSVVGWFGYRRHGLPVDHRIMGIGFVAAGGIALLALLLTEGPWVVGLAFAVVGATYLVWDRIERSR